MEMRLILNQLKERLPEGIRLSDYSLTLVGGVATKGFSMHDCDLLVRHPKSAPLGLAIYRLVSKALPENLKSSVRLIHDVQGPHSESHVPLMFLVAKKVKTPL